eukprot:gnl/TRDRNA2_/TRDRNA2_175947_c0_seq20.p1 gnl/TRDRNA2_/TRDRNA2_175947_c0~~gnl/TRDRNA2_/TRDRNA2_175947_c0_seq20.p1  ORF type:complete len:348 (-),score=55.33 gnl/TRDRNA2_/TRDRNA2_175947_c0_seq20:100-1143(-)
MAQASMQRGGPAASRTMFSGWNSFVDAAGDDVVLAVLLHLEALEVLTLVTASASTASRLAGSSDDTSNDAPHHLQVLQRFAISRMGLAATLAATTAALAATTAALAASAIAHGHLAAVRALDGTSPASQVLRWTVLLAQPSGACSSTNPTTSTSAAANAEPFLEALFRSEERGARHARSSSASNTATAAATDAALAAALAHGDGGHAVLRAAAEAVRAVENELDALVDDGRIASPGSFDTVARLRSAVEFLRGYFVAGGGVSNSATGSAKCELDSSIRALDGTIASYIKEGYELSCPRLCGHYSAIPHCGLPHAHWWVFVGHARAPTGHRQVTEVRNQEPLYVISCT